MNRITNLAIMAAVMPALSLAASDHTDYLFTGTAYNGNGIRLYEEQHHVSGSCQGNRFIPHSDTVDYVALDESLGRLNQSFARKHIDYTVSPWRPTMDFGQPAFDERMTIRNVDDREARIQWQAPTGETKNFEVKLKGNTVIDAGFVHFIRDHWDALQRGESVEFNFLAPTRGETYGFIADPTTSDTLEADLVIEMRPDSMLLSWVVDPITLGFDAEGRLTDYVGLGNIRRDKGRNYDVNLRYSETPIPCPLLPQDN